MAAATALNGLAEAAAARKWGEEDARIIEFFSYVLPGLKSNLTFKFCLNI